MAKKPKKEARPAVSQPKESVSQPDPTATSPPTSLAASAPASSTAATSIWSALRKTDAQRAIQLAVLAAIYSHVSQLSLSPVYGTVPAGLYHKYGSIAAAMLAYSLQFYAQEYVPTRIAEILPTLAFWIPTIQFVLFKYSSTFGNPYGPLITELLTYYPLVTLSLFVSVTYFNKVDLSQLDSIVSEIGPSCVSFLTFIMSQRLLKAFFIRNVGSNLLMSRVGLQIVVASVYALLIPTSLFAVSIPSLAFTMLANVHTPLIRTTGVLNGTLALEGYVLLERKESTTGYLSVIENTMEHFRVMRCDHSLLGGEWIMPPLDGNIQRVKEPIYGVFTMLEAVRLVERDDSGSKLDSDRNALAIGLGVGTAPSALIAHGIDTSIIELDLMVHKFATNYFDLPKNHTLYIGDAILVADALASANPPKTYDYIIHDCFTGSGVAPELLTSEFLSTLAALLKEDGVIAINYAGDLAMPSTMLVYRTIKSVFSQCRVFRETEAEDPAAHDMTNMIVYCTKSSNPITFRKPLEADFLGSGARKAFLLPKHEIPATDFQTEGTILKRGSTREMEKWQAQGAIQHWRVMRTVLPDAVWENW